jgi:hypothetical protein
MKNTSIAIGLGISAITGILLQAAPSQAANFSFTGNLANANARPVFNFTIDAPSSVTIQSFSYGGGKNVAGNTIAAGGFDVNLALFDAAGNGIDESDDISAFPLNLDFKYTGTLAKGSYQAIIFANGNYPNGAFPGGKLSDGFTNTGDLFGKTSFYAFDILNVTSASAANSTAVPEPFTIVGTLLGGASALRMRKRLKATNKL